MLKLVPATCPNDLLRMELNRKVKFHKVPQLIYRIDYGLWSIFNIRSRFLKLLCAPEGRLDAVTHLLSHFSFDECLRHATQCRNGSEQSLPFAVFTAGYLQASRIHRDLFRALQMFQQYQTRFACLLRDHDDVHTRFFGCDCSKPCRCKHLWKKKNDHRQVVCGDYFFVRELVNGETLFDLCIRFAAEGSDSDMHCLERILQTYDYTFDSVNDVRIALVTMWQHEHTCSNRPFQSQAVRMPPRKRPMQYKLHSGASTPINGVPAFGKSGGACVAAC